MRGLFRLFVIATCVALGVRYLGFETYRIASDSMSPSLWLGDWVAISKLDYSLRLPFAAYELVKFRRPQHSEIVAFSLPDRGADTFVKRVIGVAGDTVEIKKGILSINGIASRYEPEAGQKEPRNPGVDKTSSWEVRPGSHRYLIEQSLSETDDYGPVDIPQGYFFVLADNRSDRTDSRTWGPVPFSCLKGQVRLVLLSLNSQGNLRGERTIKWPKAE